MNDLITPEEIEQSVTTAGQSNIRLAPAFDPQALGEQLEKMSQIRKIVYDYIRYNFIKGVDYDRFHIKKFEDSCPDYKRQGYCNFRAHYTEWDITKKGCEKFMQDFAMFPDFIADLETRKQLGDKDGLICLIAKIYNRDGQYVAQGRGAAEVTTWSDTNATTKKAKKRALSDALKATGLLSNMLMIIKEMEGEIKVASQPQSAPEPQPVRSSQPVDSGSSICPDCHATGKYHKPACPNNPPTEGELLEEVE